MKALLNVGGGSKKIPIPPYYDGWRHDLLDIDPASGAELIMDARDLYKLPPATYDAVYCSHNLEHYHRHDGVKVLRGFHHVLKPDGFAEIRVPDITHVMQEVVQRGLDVDDVIHESKVGPILVRDVLWGWHVEIERSGNDFYGHKTGFTERSLLKFASAQGFRYSFIGNSVPSELLGFFFKQPPAAEQIAMIGLRR